MGQAILSTLAKFDPFEGVIRPEENTQARIYVALLLLRRGLGPGGGLLDPSPGKTPIRKSTGSRPRPRRRPSSKLLVRNSTRLGPRPGLATVGLDTGGEAWALY